MLLSTKVHVDLLKQLLLDQEKYANELVQGLLHDNYNYE